MQVTKAKFAEICGVTAARVSQWISEGKIHGAAIVGDGRSAKINVEKARAQLAKRLDPGQALGNGKKTKIAGAGANAKTKNVPPAVDDDVLDALDYALERAGLVKAQRVAQELKNEATRGEMISAKDAELRWADEIVKMRARMLAVAGDLPQLLQHLTPHDVLVIDRTIRDAMQEASEA